MARKRLGELLVEEGLLTEQSLRSALAEQKRWGGSLGRVLIDMRLIGEEDLVGALSRQLNMPTVDLDALEIPQAITDWVSADMAVQYSLIPFAQPMKFLDVAMVDPTNMGIVDELRIRTKLNVRPYLAGPKMIERAIGKYYRRGFGLARNYASSEIAVDTDEPTNTMAKPFPASQQRSTTATAAAAAQTAANFQRAAAEERAEIAALQSRVTALEALVARDENVLRKVLGLLVEKGIASREEIIERLK